MTDQYVQQGSSGTTISVPYDAFAHSKPEAFVRLQAKMGDAKALPDWIHFDPSTGNFEVTPPKAFKGQLDLKVIAQDEDGRDAASLFRLFIGEHESDVIKPQSKSSLTEQIDGMAQRMTPAASPPIPVYQTVEPTSPPTEPRTSG